jgi:hypothetical protein
MLTTANYHCKGPEMCNFRTAPLQLHYYINNLFFEKHKKLFYFVNAITVLWMESPVCALLTLFCCTKEQKEGNQSGVLHSNKEAASTLLRLLLKHKMSKLNKIHLLSFLKLC